MTQEELKMELEELAVRFSEGWHEGIKIDASDIMLLNEAAQALAQPEQEPVAIKRMKEWIEYLKRKSDFGQHMQIPSEMSAGACWELAIELEQFINTHPPQPEQEPVAWVSEDVCKGQYIDGRPRKIWWECEKGVGTAFYTTPPQRTWVDLTDDEIDNINYTSAHMLAREVLAKFKEKNNG